MHISSIGVTPVFNPERHRILHLEPLQAFIAMGSVVLAVTGAEALCRHRPLRPPTDQVQLALLRHPALR
jgi:hypothetical protein